jgi:hypothetical protein
LTPIGDVRGVIGFRSQMLMQLPRRIDRAETDRDGTATTDTEATEPPPDMTADVRPEPNPALTPPLTRLAARFR